jgi:hypothetical protein
MQNDSKPRNNNKSNKGPRKGGSNYNGNGKGRNDRPERPKAPTFSKRSASIIMSEAFKAIREDQAARPNRWSKEVRTKFNEAKALVVWSFDSGSYSQAVERIQTIMDDFKVRASFSAQPEPEPVREEAA